MNHYFVHKTPIGELILESNLKQLNESLDKAQSYKPDLVIPGHDRSFKPTK